MTVSTIFLYEKQVRYSLNPIIASVNSLRNVKVYLAGSLKELLDLAMNSSLKGEKCITGFSLLTTMLTDNSVFTHLKEAIVRLRKIGCITVGGGPHCTGDPVGTLFNLKFNYVFIGEAEESFKEFVESVRDGLDVKSIKGLAYIENDKFIFTGRREAVDLNKYDPFPYWRGILSPIEITRGCPHGCFYCQVSYVHGLRYRHRKVERVVFYTKKLLERGCRDIRFISPDGLAYGLDKGEKYPNIGILEELLSGVKKVAELHGGRVFLGTFPSEVRPEHVTKESLRLLKSYVSNRVIIIGAQSGSEQLLQRINRQHSVDDVITAVELALENGFYPDVDLIIGFPGESIEEMWSTVDLAKKIVKLGGRVHLHYYLPLPGTPLGMKTPTPIPSVIKRELSRLVGSGKGYGNWLKQEEISWKIIELHKRGIIMPRNGLKRPVSST